jgi:hypothetical protein
MEDGQKFWIGSSDSTASIVAAAANRVNLHCLRLAFYGQTYANLPFGTAYLRHLSEPSPFDDGFTDTATLIVRAFSTKVIKSHCPALPSSSACEGIEAIYGEWNRKLNPFQQRRSCTIDN